MAQLLDKAYDKRPPVLMAKAEPKQATPIAREIKRRPGLPAPEPVIATTEPPPPEPTYTEDMDSEQPTIADLVSDDAAEAIAASGNWGVQVGAYKAADNARRAADDAKRALANLAGAKPTVEETRSKHGNLYQARVVGMTEAEARMTCQQFKKKKLACLAVPPPVPNGAPLRQSAQGSRP
ncbi:MAG: SPOR domain-containing protein [Alphaproteobacteria bacterium]|nr:SPOR domain-containing protein [Alphaproteobacteria bacterium]